MKRIFPKYAYGPGPRTGCWWDETIKAPDWPVLRGNLSVDVAIVGAGFTGLSCALHLAQAGASVAVLEAETPGWGASGRNGGFCCLGGSMLGDAAIIRRYGAPAASGFRQAERDGVALVAKLIERLGIDADIHSRGETQLAHRPKDMEKLRKVAAAMSKDHGGGPVLTEAKDLAAQGLNGPFFGALTNPVGFGLNPRKYLFGLAAAAERRGAVLFQRSGATHIARDGAEYLLRTPCGQLRSGSVVIATNGYSSDDLPKWLASRYIPTQSNVLVTRPMRNAELQAQGWTSDQMAYDTRNLLHYFRLMPDRRFLFGMRGGLTSSRASEQRARRRTRKDFEAMFPAWRGVASAHTWSGMVCIARNRMPYAGPVPGHPGMFAGLAYHGNGVAMGSLTGRMLAGLVDPDTGRMTIPTAMQSPLARFPFGRARRLLMPPVYGLRALQDL
jgi:glycine/D-amino acid oxidase-like deaminating enzyme